MNTGPCLCGEPYCPRCGNPELAAHVAWLVKIDETTEDLDDVERALFLGTGLAAVKVYRETGQLRQAEALQRYQEMRKQEENSVKRRGDY